MEEIGLEGVKHLRATLKFGDIIVNHWASDNNPNKKGVFVRFHYRSIIVTDMYGNFWEPSFDHKSKIEIIGTVINSNTSSTPDKK